MLCRNFLNRINVSRFVNANYTRRFCQSKPVKPPKNEDTQENPPLGSMARKYVPFREEDAEEILDVHEERLKYTQLQEERELEEVDPFKGLNLERGKTGVFDIEDLIEVLKVENAEEIFVATVPPDVKYVNYIVIVHGKSTRHLKGIIEFVRKVYKQKRRKNDRVPVIEGAESKDWMALDLGNIALHVFTKKCRQAYDLESLWAVGPEFDSESNKKDIVTDILEQHSIYLHKLEPAS